MTRKLASLALVTCVAMGTASATSTFPSHGVRKGDVTLYPWSEETIAAADNAIIDAGYVASFMWNIPYDISPSLLFSLPAAEYIKTVKVSTWEYLGYAQEAVDNSVFTVITAAGSVTGDVTELSRHYDMEYIAREVVIVLPEAVRREDIKSFKFVVGDQGEYDYYEMEVNAADIWGGGE